MPARFEERPAVVALGQERALDFRGDLQFVVDARLLERLAVQPRVFDRHAGFVRQRIERGAGVRRQQAAFLAAVEIEHADVPGVGLHVRAIEVAHHPQRNARHVADAELHRAEMDIGEVAVEQVGDDLQLAGRKHFLGNLAAGLEAGARQRDAALGAGELHFELGCRRVGIRRQHDEATLGARHVDRRIEHQRQHFVEHAARTERAQALEKRGELAEVVDRAGVRSVGVRGALAGEEHHVGAAGAAELHPVAVRQLMLGDRLAVDVSAIAGSLVLQDPVAILLDDLGMLARHVAADQPQVALGAAADAQQLLVDGDDALAEAVVYFEARVRRGHNRLIIARRRRGFHRPLPGSRRQGPAREESAR